MCTDYSDIHQWGKWLVIFCTVVWLRVCLLSYKMGSSGTSCVSSLENSRLHAIHCLSQAAGLLKHLRRNFLPSENDQVIHNEIIRSTIENITQALYSPIFGVTKTFSPTAFLLLQMWAICKCWILSFQVSKSYLSRFN